MYIAVRYYTRSGNTARLADAIAAAIGVHAEALDKPLIARVDTLFLGCSYYAFDMDPQVKAFIAQNKDRIGRIVLFGTSAMMKSMKKPMAKVLEGTGIQVAEQEFHCRGEFGPVHKGKPDAEDLKAAAVFAKEALR